MKKDGGPAFPSHGSMGEVAQQGMSLRDHFAAVALQGMMAGQWKGDPPIRTTISAECYKWADAMLAEREKE